MTNCDKVKNLLSEYIDGRLSDEDAREFRGHLAECAACSGELRLLEEAKNILRLKERIVVPSDMDFSFSKKLKSLWRPGQASGSASLYYKRYSGQAVAAVTSVVILFLVVSNYLGAPLPAISNPNGTVKVYQSAKNEWVIMDRPIKVGKNAIVKTFQNSQVDLSVAGVFSMRLKSNTEVRIAGLGSRFSKGEIRYSVEKGKVLIYHDQKIMKNSEFNIETPESINTAIGTEFMVSVMPEANKTWLGVLDGKVLVKPLSDPLQKVMVNSGQKTEVSADGSPLAPQPLESEEWNEMQELYQIGETQQVALLISTGENRVRELLRPCPLYISHKKDNAVPDMIRETVDIFNKAIRENSKERHLEAITKFDSIISEFPDKRYNVQFLLFIGAYYCYLGQYEDAVDTFEKVVTGYPGSQLASLAQCAVGIIYEEKIGRIDKAIIAYKKILLDYPDSSEAVEARNGLGRLIK